MDDVVPLFANEPVLPHNSPSKKYGGSLSTNHKIIIGVVVFVIVLLVVFLVVFVLFSVFKKKKQLPEKRLRGGSNQTKKQQVKEQLPTNINTNRNNKLNEALKLHDEITKTELEEQERSANDFLEQRTHDINRIQTTTDTDLDEDDDDDNMIMSGGGSISEQSESNNSDNNSDNDSDLESNIDSDNEEEVQPSQNNKKIEEIDF